jgi:hypothetical protein
MISWCVSTGELKALSVMSSMRRIAPGSHVQDLAPDRGIPQPTERRHQHTAREILGAVYHWTVCLFITALVLSQIFGAVWNSITTTRDVAFGRDPLEGPYQLVGTNDIPYADRVIACVRTGRFYEPRLVSSLLAANGTDAILEDSTGMASHGYRLVQRRVGSTSDALDSAVSKSYREICSLMSATLDSILGACTALGYTNLTVDDLRVVESAESKRLFQLPGSLPVLIMPYWDNTEQARHAIPTWNGDACVFRLEDAYYGRAAANASKASFRGVNQSIRHDRTLQWLKRPGGAWRNGWYEDLEGGRWFSDVTSSNPAAPHFMGYRLFDMWTGTEMNCSSQHNCLSTARISRWGDKFTSWTTTHDINSITILNGSAFGLFHFTAKQIQLAHVAYDWETLLSNVSVIVVLFRWIMTLVALHIGVVRAELPCFGGGIGCLSGSSSFHFLLISMLPQLRMTLAAFWTVGCRFQGQQAALANAWFSVYPAIAQVMILLFSLLNLLAKMTRRRMSDVLFGPSVLLLCLLHYYSGDLAASGWLKGIDGRVPTVVLTDEVQLMTLRDYFSSDLAWRMNGRVELVFFFKLAVLGVNLLPLLAARSFPVPKRGSKRVLAGIERAFALKVNRVGGLGLSSVYLSPAAVNAAARTGTTQSSVSPSRPSPTVTRTYLNSFELIRLGYLVFGDRYVVTFDEWDVLSAMAPLRLYYHLWNHRVCVWTLKDVKAADGSVIPGWKALRSVEPEMWRLDDKRLLRIPWWHVSSCAIQC